MGSLPRRPSPCTTDFDVITVYPSYKSLRPELLPPAKLTSSIRFTYQYWALIMRPYRFHTIHGHSPWPSMRSNAILSLNVSMGCQNPW